MEYQKQLLKRLLKMIEDNEKEKIYYESALRKIPKSECPYDNEYRNAWNKLSKNEQRAYWNGGHRYSMSAMKRLRIELNKSMLEIEKGE